MIYWLVAIACGYALGTFMRGGWFAYAVCIPVSVVLYYLVNLFAPMPADDAEMPPAVFFVVGALVQSLGLMLGVFLARRKAKRNAFEA